MVRGALSILAGVWLLGGCSVYDQQLVEPDSSQAAARRGALPSDAAVIAAGSDAGAPTRPGVLRSDAGQSASAACAVGTSQDYCAKLPELARPPVIDGTLECGLTLQALPPTGWNGAAALPANTASYAAAARPDGLYVYVEVHSARLAAHPAGQPLFCGDAIELYVDAETEAEDAGSYGAGTMQFVVAAPSAANGAIEAGRFVQGNPQGAWVSKNLHTQLLADGYSVEALITGADIGLWEWSPMMQLGFSIAIDVSGNTGEAALRCGQQLGQYFLRVSGATTGCRGEPWCDVRAFCSPAIPQ